MSEFSVLQAALQSARSEHDAARDAVFTIAEKIKQNARQLAELGRIQNLQDTAFLRQKQLLERTERSLRAEQEKQRSNLAAIEQNLNTQWEVFLPFSDPRQNVPQLDDHFPVLLFPLRLETRFKKTTPPGSREQSELWVRVYPDDCLVDTFESLPTVAEIKSIRQFWIDFWKAGKQETQQRGAWTGLVQAHGSGRAEWLLEQVKPLNLADEPSKNKPEDLLLLIALDLASAADFPFSTAEKTALELFWKSSWQAGDDAAANALAYEQLSQSMPEEARRDDIIKRTTPANFNTQPPEGISRPAVQVQTAWIFFPLNTANDTQLNTWSRAPRVDLLPDRFVLMGYEIGTPTDAEPDLQAIGAPIISPLIVGIDPSAATPDVKHDKNVDGTLELSISDSMQWMFDFEDALRKGMAFRVPLTEKQAREGFDRLLVLGVRLATDAEAGSSALETLWQHHRYSKTGFEILPQGTPTNNTEKGNSAFSRQDNADSSFDRLFLHKTELQSPPAEWMNKTDGAYLAQALGMDPLKLENISGSNGHDQVEARAMNQLLWPATLGFTMGAMMNDVFDRHTIENTRHFFTQFVSGRGTIPAVRIGKQPYGILPSAAFSRLNWLKTSREHIEVSAPNLALPFFLNALYERLKKASKDFWEPMSSRVDFVGQTGGDPHQVLLHVIGLHATSVEFWQRFSASRAAYWNWLNIAGYLNEARFFQVFSGKTLPETPNFSLGLDEDGMNLLRQFGYTGEVEPDILQKIWTWEAHLLKGPVVDDRPLSESDPIRGYTPAGKNYLEWLWENAAVPDELRRQTGFTNNQAPAALLYLLSHRALLEGFAEASRQRWQEAGLLTEEAARAAFRDAPFIHVSDQNGTSESRFALLYQAQPLITGQPDQLVIDHIADQWRLGLLKGAWLDTQLAALDFLKKTPTARLERLFAEHLDCCSYRLDAWKSGILNVQLQAMRQLDAGGDLPANTGRRGIYLGAFGWLEALKPGKKTLDQVALNPELSAIFLSEKEKEPLVYDRTNAGHVLAPSLNHAVTAAILRNGYLANATPGNPTSLAVNLSSERVRRAMAIIQGIQEGQSLGALLGYQLERGLHDRYNSFSGLVLDGFILDLRLAFPLVAGQLNDIPDADTENPAIQTVEARNVINGLDLVNHIKGLDEADRKYPFKLAKLPTGLSQDQQRAIEAEIDRLLDTNDAVADLAMSESVYQVTLGNYDRAAATLDTYSRGQRPPDPEVIQTPRSGVALTHRVGLHLDPAAAAGTSPRSKAEPGLNAWLKKQLPDLSKIGCRIEFFGTAASETAFVTAKDLDLEPLDLVFLLDTANEQAMSELDDRLLDYAINHLHARPDVQIQLRYTGREASADQFTFFELAPLVASLRNLVLQSRPLRATDLILPEFAKKEVDVIVFLDKSRLLSARADMENLRQDLQHLPVLPVPDPDSYLATLPQLLLRASLFGLRQSSIGECLQWKKTILERLLKKAGTAITKWKANLGRFDDFLTAFDADPLAPESVRLDLLRKAEREVSTLAKPGDTVALLELPIKAKRAPFADKVTEFETIFHTRPTNIAPLKSDLEAAVAGTIAAGSQPLSDYDPAVFSMAEEDTEIERFLQDLQTRASRLENDLSKKLTGFDTLIADHDATSDPKIRLERLHAAAKILFGEDFRVIPTASLPAESAQEWANCQSSSADLLVFQKTILKNDFPMDDWLHGLARVREKMTDLENVILLSGAFGVVEPALLPAQFPYQGGDRWLGLQFRTPGEQFNTPTADRLIYTYILGAVAQQEEICGLLLDEWTEVIPSADETAGLAFHFDRPNAEPPQCMLLALPTEFGRGWQWQDLVDTLHETLDGIKQRAVEPAFVDDTALARFLPATMTTVTTWPITLTTNFSVNNQFFTQNTSGDGT